MKRCHNNNNHGDQQDGALGAHLQGRVAFQGRPGANSHRACRCFASHLKPWARPLAEDALSAVDDGSAAMALLPVDNLLGGRVADLHRLLPTTTLSIIGEALLPIQHCLLTLPGADIAGIHTVYSHPQALMQCRGSLQKMGLNPQSHTDTAGAAEWVSSMGDKGIAAIASVAAAEIYGLEVAHSSMEDNPRNATRFWAFARDPLPADDIPLTGDDYGQICTALLFECRSIPAALYKCLGGFATEGINLLRLESYVTPFVPNKARFFVEAQRHKDDSGMQRALAELGHFTKSVKVLGSYHQAWSKVPSEEG